MSQCDPSSEGLADLLAAHSEDILRRWQEQVGKTSSPRELSPGELVDSLPEFLEAVVAVLRGKLSPGATPPPAVDIIAEAHGAQRFHVGIEMSEVVREYSVRRRVILELLQEEACPLDFAAVQLLMDAIATAAVEALRRYAMEHERALRASQAELRESEMRYRLATLATSDAIWDWDIGSGQVHWSENIHGLTGYAQGEVDPAFSWWTSHVHPEDRAQTMRSLHAALEGGEAHWVGEYRFQRADGSYMFVRDKGYLVREAQGRAVRMVGALQDITEHRQAEEEARRRAGFEQHLIGIVSHDLRNPLNAILMATALLLKHEGLDEPHRRSLYRILTSARRATRMLSDLLDFTQARLGGTLPVTPRPLDLHALTRQVVEEIQIAHPRRRVLLEQSGDGRGAWDGDRLAQLITNLVNNAISYGQEHHAVRVRTLGLSGSVLLSVHNMGKPIPPELMPQLFQPLRRGECKGSQGGHSIGLGLFIVKHIVDAHGGSIHVDSTEENGTTFTVSLPRRPAGAHPPLHP